jgi:hypothetical protein
MFCSAMLELVQLGPAPPVRYCTTDSVSPAFHDVPGRAEGGSSRNCYLSELTIHKGRQPAMPISASEPAIATVVAVVTVEVVTVETIVLPRSRRGLPKFIKQPARPVS